MDGMLGMADGSIGAGGISFVGECVKSAMDMRTYVENRGLDSIAFMNQVYTQLADITSPCGITGGGMSFAMASASFAEALSPTTLSAAVIEIPGARGRSA